MNNIFVTGIGTGIGKTLISAICVKAFNLPYWKPIQCGDLDTTDAATIKKLVPESEILLSRYKLQAPLSPHAAARLEKVEINLFDFVCPAGPTIIEGAGGVLVPINETHFIIDLIPQLQASAIIVVPYYLGSINHTLLTINEIKRRGLKILGLIFNGDENLESKNIILTHHKLPVLLEIPHTKDLNPEIINRYALTLRKNLNANI
jgi:dethiobiotin synthetase